MELVFIERVYHAEELLGQLTIHGWCSLPLACWEQRGRCGAVERRFARRHQEVQQATRLLTAGSYHSQQPLGEPTPSLAVRAEAALAPQHRRSQGALRSVVRGLDALYPCKRPQRRPPLGQLPAQPRRFAVRALLPTPQEPPQPGLE